MSQLQAFLLTLGLELGLAAACWAVAPVRRALGLDARLGRTAIAVLAVSCVTHPFAWWANTVGASYGFVDFGPRAALIESAVIIVEGLLLAYALPAPLVRAQAFSAVLNLGSFGLGLVIAAL